MKTHLLSTFATASVFALSAGLVFNFLAIALFAITASALILAIVATDYAPRRELLTPSLISRRHALPYAA